MKEYQQRVCDEALELQDKLNKLLTFQRSFMFADVPSLEQQRLFSQAKAMVKYYAILCERIANFPE